jgi:hypothetical protein
MAGLNGVVLKSRQVPDAVARVLAFLHVPTVADTTTWHWGGPHQFNMVLAAMVIALAMPNAWDWSHQSIGSRPRRLTAVFVAAVFCLSVLLLGRPAEFVYFKF